uniref:Putative NAD(P)-binding domain-containing protein n=1 Tax=Helianthus annuus TaxID=4232 RepID=A0A251V1H3_HELAN
MQKVCSSHHVKRLLEEGYYVITTIRSNAGDTTKYDMLTKTDFVHVDDVVRAHIHLLEYPHAKGRYICQK